jgi:UDP-N-acetylglucosamine 4-epimerase
VSNTNGLVAVGLRYFNVFGPRQNPEGEYSAVVPRWMRALLRGEPCHVYGDGDATRDYCHVTDVVTANLLAATAPDEVAGDVYNVAYGCGTTLDELYGALRDRVVTSRPQTTVPDRIYEPMRPGDIKHSYADLTNVSAGLGFRPTLNLDRGLDASMGWYLERFA